MFQALCQMLKIEFFPQSLHNWVFYPYPHTPKHFPRPHLTFYLMLYLCHPFTSQIYSKNKLYLVALFPHLAFILQHTVLSYLTTPLKQPLLLCYIQLFPCWNFFKYCTGQTTSKCCLLPLGHQFWFYQYVIQGALWN